MNESNRDFTPIPTQYDGVLFRSKSEAIFARALDMAGFTTWEYEPIRFEMDGWSPDFWVVRRGRGHKIFSMVVEYKPSEVTDAYLAQLASRYEKMKGRLYQVSELIAFGSSFTKERHVLARTTSGWRDVSDNCNFFSFIEQASAYRFDLKH